MSNDELAKYGFELCEMGGECDFCEKDVEQPNYFWRSTSYEYVEGDYYCRECASKEAFKFDGFLTQLALDGGDSAALQTLSTPEVLSTLQVESTPTHRK